MIKSFFQLLQQVYLLVRPYGRFRLAMVLTSGLLQGLFQAIGVSSIAPFLMLAANPDKVLQSALGLKLVSMFPQLGGQAFVVLAGLSSIVMLFVANAVSLWADFTRARYAHHYGHWLRMRILWRLLHRPYVYFVKQNTSVLTKKVVNDVSNFSNSLLIPLLDALARIATAVFLLAALFILQPWVAAAAIGGLGTYYLLVFRFLRHRRASLSRSMKESYRGEFYALGQLFGALKMIFARDCASAFVRPISRYSAMQARAGAIIPVYSGVPRYILEPIAYGALIAWILLAMAAGSELSAILPSVGVVAMAGYRLLPNLQNVYANLVSVTTARHSLEEILSELQSSERPAGIARGEQAVTRLVDVSRLAETQQDASRPRTWTETFELANITYTYQGASQPAVKNLNLTIRKGSAVGFVGPTGSGKSTLADLILGLLTPDSGQLLLDGTPLTKNEMSHWRSGIGYVPQDIFLLDATIAENIAFGVSNENIDDQRVRESARLAQLLNFIEGELPLGLQTLVGERGVCLSGGQRQRIGLARALYFKPQLLILDEATSALDNETESLLLSSIRSLPNSMTVVMIAHRLSTVTDCQLICYMVDGTIQGQGDYERLKATCPGFRQLASLGRITGDAA